MLFDWSWSSLNLSALPNRRFWLFVCKHFWLHRSVILDRSVDWSQLVNTFDIFLLVLLAPQSASGLRQNLFTNRLGTCIWSSTRITLDYLATTRSSTPSKLIALRLGNLWLSLPRIVIVDWSWYWCSKKHVGYVQATLFSHHYDGSFGGFVEHELQLLLYHHRIEKGVDL